MPIYIYKCPQCNKTTEVLKSITDTSKEICPQCQQIMTKQITNTYFKLTGHGFHDTDYKK